MRPLYLILRITLPYAFSVFFRRRKALNSQRTLHAQTIIVCNHPSAFLDPLIIANLQWPIVFFMTRSDVFKSWLKPVTWACHMVPIYRAEQDGAGTYEKNKEVFRGIRKVLQRKKSLIVFGEGYTDDVFVRSLKPMKKGAARIGLGTMDASDWKLDIKIQPTAVNYSNPNEFRSDVLLSCGRVIYLQDYKERYEENPNKAIRDLTLDIGEQIKENLTYLEDKHLTEFLDNIMMINRKGMHYKEYDYDLSLTERFKNSRAFANKINQEYSEDNTTLVSLKEKLQNYVKKVAAKKLTHNEVFSYTKRGLGGSLALKLSLMLILLPFGAVGLIHNLIPYLIVSNLVQKLFKRKVFWSGVKMVLGGIVWMLFNLPIFWILPDYLPESIGYWGQFAICFAYFFIVPAITFICMYSFAKRAVEVVRLLKAKKSDLEAFKSEYIQLQKDVQEAGF